jgi:DNA-binding transcriptional MocR family regulator
MTSARWADPLRVIEKLDLPIIEDNVYGFLDDEPPLAALAPDSCNVVDSLSKKVALRLSLGFVVPAQRLRESVMASVRSGGWTASEFAFAAAQPADARRHRHRADEAETPRCARASETGDRSSFGF